MKRALSLLSLLLLGCDGSAKPAETIASPPRARILFLHGMLAPGQETRIDPAMKAQLEKEGFEVVTPAGRVGLCDWAEDVKAARCWPSDESKLETAKAIAAELKGELKDGRPTIVAGFSSGGAFATLIGLHGYVPACGFATLHGFPAGALHAEGPKRPLLLTAGKGAEWEPKQLDETKTKLEELGWRYETKLHTGAHAVNEMDVKALIAFAKTSLRDCR